MLVYDDEDAIYIPELRRFYVFPKLKLLTKPLKWNSSVIKRFINKEMLKIAASTAYDNYVCLENVTSGYNIKESRKYQDRSTRLIRILKKRYRVETDIDDRDYLIFREK